MGKSKDLKTKKSYISKTVNIGPKKRCSLTRFKGKGYIHFKNLFNGNHVSLDEEEFAKLMKKRDKIPKLLAKIKSDSKKEKKGTKDKESPVPSSAEDSSGDNTEIESE
jgi:hypothetical protein